ncbi:MAG: hypothetical protein ABSD88_00435 [Candidatus Korobacteraceae bacterium]
MTETVSCWVTGKKNIQALSPAPGGGGRSPLLLEVPPQQNLVTGLKALFSKVYPAIRGSFKVIRSPYSRVSPGSY